ncbi:MAG: NADH-quinone oxidoreductase subunit A [Gemmataceae bacterium]
MMPLAAYLLLFVAVGVAFIFVHLLAGKLIRPSKQSAEKQTTYECGEPTIGTSWVQFDLRFYVVALLFVIFDVEVAFLFPWAEVFGRANAIRSCPVPAVENPDPAQYREFATRVADLSSPAGSTSGKPLARGVRSIARERAYWNKLASLDATEFAAYKGLDPRLHQLVQRLGEHRIPDVLSLNEETIAQLKLHATQIEAKLSAIDTARKAEADQLLRALDGLDAGKKKTLEKALLPPGAVAPTGDTPTSPLEGFRRSLASRPEQIQGSLQARPLTDLAIIEPAELAVIPTDPRLRKVLGQVAPELLAEATRAAETQAEALREVSIGTVDSLTRTAPVQKELWAQISPEWLHFFASLNDEQLHHLRAVTPTGMVALQYHLPPVAREAADEVAWLALVEFLAFFGVLLVGFAYLWRRGDLEWVRSLRAEQEGAPSPASSAPAPAGPVGAGLS